MKNDRSGVLFFLNAAKSCAPRSLSGCSRRRRVIVLRRRTELVGLPELSEGTQPNLLNVKPVEPYVYVLLVTNTDWGIAGLGRLYWEQADSENTIDELKRQWGWGVCDAGPAALPGGGAHRGADLQMVESLCAVC